MTHTICINGKKHQVTLSHATTLNDILLQHAAYITNIPNIYDNNSSLWVLLNEKKTANALTYIVGYDPPHSIISIEYAMSYPYFQRCTEIMQKNGIYVSDINIGFLVFTLFNWMKKETTSEFYDTVRAHDSALIMMRCYPDYFSQPLAFTHTYYEIIQRAKTEKTLNIHKTLK